MDTGVAEFCPVLTQLTEPAKYTTEWDLQNPHHIVNDKNRSGKREGMSVMIGDYIYVATGSEPTDVWIRMPRQERATFGAGSTETMQADATSGLVRPTAIRGLATQGKIVGFDVQSDKVRNVSGRTLENCSGTFTIDIDKVNDGLGTSQLYIWSQISDDGITWEAQPYSLRHVEVASSSESTYTYTSFVRDWRDKQYVRLVFAVKSGSSIRVRAISELVGSDVIHGYGFLWEMEED
ncbi:hypothetical protein vBVpaPMGD2_7 [Vibrio phage vB_VpaP_MGD2]|uniref:Uncharacterized protein n=1 Tax=Vibrio phage vB_VpaP_MGD2 TaxID=2565877 RepID=A0A6B7HXW4_9CAUD|nr:hypothetical protein vBVpaPMGD2_7 [Vibrio phage vB_VpaP_MGD2]